MLESFLEIHGVRPLIWKPVHGFSRAFEVFDGRTPMKNLVQ